MDLTSFAEFGQNFNIKQKSDKFKFELNLGLALPSKFRMSKNFDRTKEFVSLIQSVSDDGSIAVLKVKTQSEKGPLGGFDNDVLAVLLTLASEQRERSSRINSNGFRVYYTLSEICRRLGLCSKSTTVVSEAIANISSQNLVLNNFIYKSSEKKAIKDIQETKIILKRGRVTAAKGSDDGETYEDYSSFFYLEFDSNVISNLFNDYVSVLSSKTYLSLRSGPYRRLYIFLSSKKKNFGDRFVFSLKELAQVLGLEDSSPRKQREFIGNYLKEVSEELKSFDFVIQKDRGKNSWTVYIEYKDINLISAPEEDEFYSNLKNFYGEDKLSNLGLVEIDIVNMREEFSRKYKLEKETEEFEFQGEFISASEFAIDIALFQVLKKGYTLTKTFKALAKTILKVMCSDSLEIPDGYRYFIYKRIQLEERERQKESLLEIKLKREQEEKTKKEEYNKAFDNFYVEIVQKNKRQMAEYNERAHEELMSEGLEKEDPFYNLRVQTKVKEYARYDFDNCDMLNLAKSI